MFPFYYGDSRYDTKALKSSIKNHRQCIISTIEVTTTIFTFTTNKCLRVPTLFDKCNKCRDNYAKIKIFTRRISRISRLSFVAKARSWYRYA